MATMCVLTYTTAITTIRLLSTLAATKDLQNSLAIAKFVKTNQRPANSLVTRFAGRGIKCTNDTVLLVTGFTERPQHCYFVCQYIQVQGQVQGHSQERFAKCLVHLREPNIHKINVVTTEFA